MLKKSYSSTGKFCRVTFRVPAELGANTVALCGDFNEWNAEATPMRALKDGAFSVTVSLDAEKSYRFRYLLDGERWENDEQADKFIANDYGSDDSIIEV